MRSSGIGMAADSGRIDREVLVFEHAADLSRLRALVADIGWSWPEWGHRGSLPAGIPR